MKHRHHWLFFWYHDGCVPCKLRQLRYGFRMDPVGYNECRMEVVDDPRFSKYEKVYILNKCKAVEIDYD